MFREVLAGFFRFVRTRLFFLIFLVSFFACVLIWRIFDLQIVRGADYLDSFQLLIRKQRSIPGTRGRIFDRNGNLLAYNELSNSVTIEDVYESGKSRNRTINDAICALVNILTKNGDDVIRNLPVEVDHGEYVFTVSGVSLLRFLADVYGHASIEDLEYEERIKTAAQVIADLCTNFGIGEYADPEHRKDFMPGSGYTREMVIRIASIRYAMSLNSYQKYITTTIAERVSDETVADVSENSDILPGISIVEETARTYIDPKCFSQILGYIGKVSQEELVTLQEEQPSYDNNDTVGKTGIEQSMELELQGMKGQETVFVDKVGQVIDTSESIDPSAGADVYITLDKNLQKACYDILEERLAGIIIAKLVNIHSYTPDNAPSGSKLMIPIYDVYYAMFNNSVLDTSHFGADDAGETEREVLKLYEAKKEAVLTKLEDELKTALTPYENLTLEYQVYESLMATILYDSGIIDSNLVDREDETYIAWTTDETISLSEYIRYCISMNWVNVSLLPLDNQYSDSEQIFDKVVSQLLDKLNTSREFEKRLYRFMLANDQITGAMVCDLLLEQNAVTLPEDEASLWERRGESAFTWMQNRIKNLDITPAQLALDPCTGSIVITDVNTGDVLALVSYPSYDNNMMTNGVDAAYFAKIRADLTNPQYNYATQQRTAPGSTYKMVSAAAGLMEGVITTGSHTTCTGTFEEVYGEPKCWIWPGAHGSLNVTGAIKNSCNYFFYDVGYMLGMINGNYSSDRGVQKLAKYADMFGLSEKTGIEINENEPMISDKDSVRSAIGQGTNSFTTVGLARYVSTVANSGTCFNLTLIDRVVDRKGNLLYDKSADIRNHVNLDSSYWDAIHAGMRQVVESRSDYEGFAIKVAGKTGTAQESKSRPNHALFVCYAPYDNPEIAVATRIAYGYTSSYAAQITKDVLAYYYDLQDSDQIVTGTAQELMGGEANAD
ncbi:MAG: penicillin-binding protein [Lachnospiraceae bacterium]|nr:penicillin-binding protein [Lachnospiraceae bacterium]